MSIADATDTKSAIDNFVSQNGGAGDWPIVTDPSSEVRISYGVAKTPETWIIDPDGVVRARIITTLTATKLDETPATRLRERAGMSRRALGYVRHARRAGRRRW